MRNRNRIYIIILILAVVILGGLCFAILFRGDREKPIITIDQEYLENCNLDDKDDILKAVSATDNVTENVQVFITEIISFSDGSYKISFIAKDEAGNISIAETKVKRNASVQKDDEPANVIESEGGEENTESLENQEEAREVSDNEVVIDESPSEVPVISLVTNNATIPIGSQFKYLNYIASITDDVDDISTLSGKIVIFGSYDTNVAGVYELVFSVTDSDGNKANSEVFTLTVE